jgi:hypothetical protein
LAHETTDTPVGCVPNHPKKKEEKKKKKKKKGNEEYISRIHRQ